MRNFNPIMAMAAELTIVQVAEVVPVAGLDPDDIHTPAIFVDRVVKVGPEEGS
jgi:acyl CoA:acetate/3-ketoacid CoA transferase alpha subunit